MNWFTRIIFFDGCICYTKTLGVTRILQFSQYNDKLPLPLLKQVNYTVIPIYAGERPQIWSRGLRYPLRSAL